MILLRKHGVSIEEVWFGEKPTLTSDIIQIVQSQIPVEGADNLEFHTLALDIAKDPEQLLAGFESNTRNEVRRARDKDLVTAEAHFDDAQSKLDKFIAFYDPFAASKGLKPADKEYLSQMAKGGRLLITVARAPEGEALVYHAYYFANGRARLLLSASHFRDEEDKAKRQVVGRANRYLHYADMIAARALGATDYDFGGWYAGDADESKSRINKFKESFGGAVRVEYNAQLAITMKGNLALKARKILRR